MTAADHTPSPATDGLRDEERRSLGCYCTRLDDVWHHIPDCPVPAVERILAARLAEVEQERDAFKRQYNAGFREWQQAHTEAAREKARADALAEQVAALEALADGLEAPATKMQIISADPAPSIRQAIGSELRAVLAAHPAPDDEIATECEDGVFGSQDIADALGGRGPLSTIVGEWEPVEETHP